MEIHQTDSPRKTVVIVPGNPGICDYYKEYMEFLADRVPSDWNLVRIPGPVAAAKGVQASNASYSDRMLLSKLLSI